MIVIIAHHVKPECKSVILFFIIHDINNHILNVIFKTKKSPLNIYSK